MDGESNESVDDKFGESIKRDGMNGWMDGWNGE